MSEGSFSAGTGFLSPEDLAFLENVVIAVCGESAARDRQEKAGHVAAMAIELYQSGLTDQSAIIERVRYL
ncbi:hypothetical protein HFC70_20285 [Agrobacterium sp. a22-2]|uniref:hypothetical protein n=1 Tax=Agrobacterium sp. a22-2 TaxID=2283840 RepID=UPI0014486132|nr:hypothetical protein [Agrobacterium sp. a22-2]NKN38694.1 hypothetical protein [Agrobacterium sp. a22-2]